MTAKIDCFEDARRATLLRALDRAPFEGWTSAALARAGADAGVDRSLIAAAFPKGVADLLSLWSDDLDRAMMDAMAGPEFAGLKIREKVAFGVRARLAALHPHKEAARRAAATLALPLYAGLGLKLVWNTADAIWRGLGDTSTDFNFYSKRAILSGVWATTFARWVSDDGAGQIQTNDFLDKRIENVMQFEKAKAKFREAGFDPARPLGWLAKLRFPVRG